MSQEQGYDYERGEGRRKHRWNRDEAGFEPSHRGPIGKCHCSIDEATASDLLVYGLIDAPLYGPEDAPEHPDHIYNIYRGVPYVAVPTMPGRSYHGYPFRGRMSANMRRRLRERAVKDGMARVFDEWMKRYGKA